MHGSHPNLKMSSGNTAVIALSLLLAVWVCFIIASWVPERDCLGAPYLYVTFHHDEKGIRKYSRDGCLLSHNILGGRKRDKKIKEARGIQIAPYRDHKALYVVQAMSTVSSVRVYGECDGVGNRKLLTTGPSIHSSMGLNHPYGMAFDKTGNLYVSCQHTNTVLRFEKDTFAPMPLPRHLQHVPLINERKAKSDIVPSVDTAVFNGTFFQYEVFPEKKKHKMLQESDIDKPMEGVRGITFVGDTLWVACENIKGISMVNPEGVEVHRLSVGHKLKPVGLLYDQNNTGLVLVSTRGKKAGPVKAINPVTRKVEREYHTKGQKHSTGMAIYENTLFVACQNKGAILTFDLHSGEFLGKVATRFPDIIERLEISDC